MYTLTFALGSALAGLAGGLFAPTATIVPFFGTNYIVEAFVTVIVGGANALVGTPIAAALLSSIAAALGTVRTLHRPGGTAPDHHRHHPRAATRHIRVDRPLAGAAQRREGKPMRRGASLLTAENIAFVVFLIFMLVYPMRTDEFGL